MCIIPPGRRVANWIITDSILARLTNDAQSAESCPRVLNQDNTELKTRILES
jgi:hypothetical protein